MKTTPPDLCVFLELHENYYSSKTNKNNHIGKEIEPKTALSYKPAGTNLLKTTVLEPTPKSIKKCINQSQFIT
jgi:hypothetical protein